MTSINREHVTSPNTTEMQQIVTSMGTFFGIAGLEVHVSPGSGWSCSPTAQGIKITVDPLQIQRKHEQDSPESSTGEVRLSEVLHTAAHEIGHAKDLLEGGLPISTSSKDHFFWNCIHDTVIDTRLRHIPLLDDVTNDLYDEVLFPTTATMTDIPKHVQFMHACLIETVSGLDGRVIDDDVQTALENLINFPITNNQTVNVFETLTSLHTSVRDRARIAKQFILPAYNHFYKEDIKQNNSENSQEQSESGQSSFDEYYEEYESKMHSHSTSEETGSQQSSTSSDKAKSDETASSEAQDSNGNDSSESSSLAEAIKEALEDLQKPSLEVASDDSDKQNALEEASVQPLGELATRLAGSIKQEMNLPRYLAEQYVEVLLKYRQAINQVADIFLMLASYADASVAPRYKPRASQDGRRLHPATLTNAAIQARTRRPHSVWQPIDRSTPRQELVFGGLDIHLIVDVSGSMEGENAENAAACSLILLEALDVAKAKAQTGENHFQQPDVRCQVVAFGSGSQVLSPLERETTAADKGTVYHHLSNPSSSSTYIADALEEIVKATNNSPDRDSIGIIITDGDFHDHFSALKLVRELNDNCELTQLNIGFDPSEGPLATQSQTLEQPSQLPERLYALLNNYIAMYKLERD